MSKKTITIPSNVGSTTITETFGKITLSPEVKELLSALHGEISVRYNPDGEKPIISVISSNGKTICSLNEFKALSGYRRFVNDAVKQVEKENATNKKVELIAFFLRQANAQGVTVPSRILEQNMTKFNQIGSSLQLVEKHLGVIAETIDNEWKAYLQDTSARMICVLYKAQVLCMSSEVLPRDWIDRKLIEVAVPKWIYNKFLDKNFTNNLKNDCVTLLFPKNNYLKSIAMTTTELNDEPFLTKNKVVLVKSGAIIAMSRFDFSALFPRYSPDLDEQVQDYLKKYFWVLTNPYTSDEVLSIRETGKAPPVFREAQPPKKTGQKQRPETELAKTCRLIGNLLGRFQSNWNGIMNFVVPVANPKTEFWAVLYTSAPTWSITPTNSIYNCIRSNGVTPLNAIRDATNATLLRRIGQVLCQSIQVPPETTNGTRITGMVSLFLNKQAFHQMDTYTFDMTTAYPLGNLGGMETTPPTAEEITAAKVFLGIKDHKQTRNRKSGASAVRLGTAVLNELRPIKDEPIYEPVVNWLMTTFKTNKALQLVAAERILGAAIRHQEEIFNEEIDEDDLQDIEDYYSDEE